MKNSSLNIHIIGAGISGLVAANVLEKKGYHPIVLEATDNVGGRVKTDVVDGYCLDHGFQVLLTAYPMAKKYLDYKSLKLNYFKPGAALFSNGNRTTIGDPIRDPSFLISSLSSKIGSLRDKIKIFQLNRELQSKSLEAIFDETETSTLAFLQNYGFSEKVIQGFFKPFFSGIFLEPNLDTSIRMFQFVYKMFGEGLAALPATGIGAISKQLESRLDHTTFHFNTTVKQVKEGKIVLENQTILDSDYTIIATDAHPLMPNLKNQEVTWKSCDNLYFLTSQKVITQPLIGLVSDENALINNIFYPTTFSGQLNNGKELLSVTIVKKHGLSPKELIQKTTDELKIHFNIQDSLFLKHYPIKKALPQLSNLKNEIEPSETKLTSTVFLAGDTMLNGSLNAAMLSGERAAESVMASINSETFNRK
ncbi:MAG: NAD(P)-binding protein [Eudoraea sp.]|nr:NAD(P)-binding protein [Eudoraea sp.]